MADRAVVMHEGRVTAILERDQVDEHRIMAHATGTVGTNRAAALSQVAMVGYSHAAMPMRTAVAAARIPMSSPRP